MQKIHFVLTPSGEVHLYATKFLQTTNTQGCRLKYWRVDTELKPREKPTVCGWPYLHTGQDRELQYRLGEGYEVIHPYRALNYIAQGATKHNNK